MQISDRKSIEELSRLLEFFQALTRKAHNDVESKRDTGYGRRQLVNQVPDLPCIIVAPHSAQDRIAAGLQGYMQVRTEFFSVLKTADDLLCDQLRLQRAEPDQLQPLNIMQSLYYLWQSIRSVPVEAKVYPSQNDLFVT